VEPPIPSVIRTLVDPCLTPTSDNSRLAVWTCGGHRQSHSLGETLLALARTRTIAQDPPHARNPRTRSHGSGLSRKHFVADAEDDETVREVPPDPQPRTPAFLPTLHVPEEEMSTRRAQVSGRWGRSRAIARSRGRTPEGGGGCGRASVLVIGAGGALSAAAAGRSRPLWSDEVSGPAAGAGVHAVNRIF
jgi:hypothetical protein